MSRRPRLPKYRRHSSGQAFVEINGHRHYLGVYGSDQSKERYQRIIAELCTRPNAALANKSPVDRADGITVVELVAACPSLGSMISMPVAFRSSRRPSRIPIDSNSAATSNITTSV